jgi:DUF2891 family protein
MSSYQDPDDRSTVCGRTVNRESLSSLVRLRPQLPGSAETRAALDRVLTPEGIDAEAAFFTGPGGAHWERPYGWAWLLLLDAELRTWADGTEWAKILHPLSKLLRARWLAWLPAAARPTRAGTHVNTAFATGLVPAPARATGDEELTVACVDAALRWYAADTGYGGFEPDFPVPSRPNFEENACSSVVWALVS